LNPELDCRRASMIINGVSRWPTGIGAGADKVKLAWHKTEGTVSAPVSATGGGAD